MMKLVTRLTLLFLPLAILPLALVGYLAYDSGRRTIEQNVFNHLMSTNFYKQAELNRWIEDSEHILRNVANRPLLREYTAVLASRTPSAGSGQGPLDTEYQAAYESLLEDHLIPTLEEVRSFLSLSILRGDDGLILISTDKSMEGKYRESEAFFVEGKNRTYVENVTYSLTLGGLVMHISTPITDREGKLLGVLAGHADLGELSRIIEQRSSPSQTEDTYLVNTFHFFVTEPRFGQGYALKKAAYSEGVNACLAGNDGVGLYADYRDVPVIGAYRWLPERQLCILTEVDQAEAYAPIVALRNTILGFGIGVALAVALLCLVFARTITRPVHRLVRGAEQIGRGNLDYRIEVRGRDEIAQLSGAFNQMAQDLQAITASRDELNREITERKRAEEKYGLIIKTALDGFWINDLAGRFLEVNESYCKMVGYTREELLTMSIPDIEALEKPEDVAQRMKKVTEQGHDRFETRHRRTDGKILDIEVSINYVPLEEQCFVFLRDITARKRAEEERVKAVSAVVDAMGDALVLHTLDGKITFVNPAYERLTGYDRRELVGKDAADVGAKVTKPEDAQKTVTAIETALKGEVPVPVPITLISKEGREVPVAFTVSFMRDASDEPSTAVVVFKDITEIKRTEEELRHTLAELEASRKAALNMMADADEARSTAEQANERLRREIAERVRAEEELRAYRDQLEELVEKRTGELREAQERLIRQEKLAVLGQLAGGVGHELRNPLGAIKNAAYYLNMVLEDADAETQEMLEVLDKEVGTAEKIISSLLDYARARPPTRRKVDLNAVVRETLARTPLPDAPPVEVALELDEDLPLILADPDQLFQVLGNIVRNGIQAMPGGGRLAVTTAVESPEWVTVAVADTGAGIPEENLNKIFEPLFTTRAKGIGLGLAVVKTLVEGHGGTIGVESQVGEGSTFTVRLPNVRT
jgi:PAS domain S-box-containing protein